MLVKCSMCGKEIERPVYKVNMYKNSYCSIKCNSLAKNNKRIKFNEIVEYKEYAVIKICSKKHGNIEVLIDIEDVEKCNKHCWCVTYCKPTNSFYVMTKVKEKGIKLHRLVMQPEDGMDIDHLNHDTLDNRKSNLRICTRQENNLNIHKNSNNKTGYRNICFVKNRYIVQLSRSGKKIFVKRCLTLDEAVRQRDLFKGNYVNTI